MDVYVEGYVPYEEFLALNPVAIPVDEFKPNYRGDYFELQRKWNHIRYLSRRGNLIFGVATDVATEEQRAFLLGSSRCDSQTEYSWLMDAVEHGRLKLVGYYHIARTKVQKHLIASEGAKRRKYEVHIASLFEVCKEVFLLPPFADAKDQHARDFVLEKLKLQCWFNMHGWIASITVEPQYDVIGRMTLSVEGFCSVLYFLHSRSLNIRLVVDLKDGWQAQFAQEVTAIYDAFDVVVPKFNRDQSEEVE